MDNLNTPWTAEADEDDIWTVHDTTGAVVFFGMDEQVAKLFAAAPELLEQAKLLERSLVYQIGVNEGDGDDEGASMKTLTLHFVRQAISKATVAA